MVSGNPNLCAVSQADFPPEQVEWEFCLTLTARQLKHTDAVALLLHVVDQIEMDDNKLSARLFMVLSELVNNALDHGLLKLDSALKHSRQGFEHYFEERAARLALLEQGEIRLRVCKLAGPARQCLKIDVHDSGGGFNHAEMLPCGGGEASMARHGRGIALVKSMSGAMRYNGTGSEVHVCLPVGGVPCNCPYGQETGGGQFPSNAMAGTGLENR
ncbi:MAG: ATP-binding protein [Nitrosomonadales bacterium]|nr:ATP-binding protein [Nitrosomonadales bacterium]